VNVDLKYFSGTGNSYKILDTCRKSFTQSGCNTRLSSITDKSTIDDKANLIGFCFPVYAFGIPRICRKYLQNLPEFLSPINTFLIITAGEQCMRCVNYCPKQAIFQNGEGSIKGKNIYYEPSFKPLKIKGVIPRFLREGK